MASHSVYAVEKSDAFIANIIMQLLHKLEPIIKSTWNLTDEELAQEICVKLLKEDESISFEAEIVERLENLLKQDITSEIEDMLNQSRCITAKSHELISQQVISRIISSGNYIFMEKQFDNEIEKLTEKLEKNFSVELKCLELSSTKKINQRQRESVISLSDVDSLNDSFNFSNFQFLRWDQFEEMLEKCGADNELQDKINSLSQLTRKLNPQFLDHSSAERLFPILEEGLLNGDLQFARVTLLFYSKMLASAQHIAVKSMFVHLLDLTIAEFNSSSHLVPLLNQGISVENNVLLLIFRVIHRCQTNIVENWIRLPQADIRTISNKIFHLIQLTKPKNFLTPLHIFSLLDPDANFLRRWLKTSHGHKIWLESFNWAPFLDHLACKLLSSLHTELKVETIKDNSTFHYDKSALEYLHAYTTLNILAIFLNHKQTMKFCLEGKRISSLELLIILITKLFNFCTCQVANIKKYCIGHCIARICQQLLSVESDSLMLNEDVILNIASPILQCLDLYSQSKIISVLENSLILSCTLLTHYARNSCTAPFFLQSNMCQIVQKFTQKLLENALWNSERKQTFSIELKLQFIRLCSFIYINHRTVDLYLTSQIPQILYSTWKTAGKNTILAESDGNDQSPDAVLPDFYLRFLAYFLATPKGLLKLQEIGAVEESVCCLVHNSPSTFTPFEFENVSDLLLRASTMKEGILSLDESYYFSSSIAKLWKLCEYDIEDSNILSFDNIDKKIQLQVDQLLSYLSTFSAISALTIPKISHQTSPSTWPPRSLKQLLSFILLFEKLNTTDIFNIETFELMRLLVLSGIVSSLDSSLLLQTQYNYQSYIIAAQQMNKSDEMNQVIINEISVARHNLLVKTMCIGGPGEKISPIKNLDKVTSHLIYPILDDSEISDYYISRFEDDTDDTGNPMVLFLKNLNENHISHDKWLHVCTGAFKDALMSGYHNENALFQTMERYLQLSHPNMPNTPQLLPILTNLEINPVYKYGIKLTMKYGIYLGLFDKTVEWDLSEFLVTCQDTFVESTSVAKSSSFPWFAATIFLMSSGSKQLSMKFLARIQNSQRPDLLWLSTPHNCGSGADVVQNANDVVWTWLSHSVEEIVAEEIPYLYSAFKMASASITNICYLWLRQCFWNYLDWPEICNFIVQCVLFGPSYVVFYLIAVLSHMQEDLLIRAQRMEVNEFLLEEPLHGFKLKTYFHYLHYLSEKYNGTLKMSMNNLIIVNR